MPATEIESKSTKKLGTMDILIAGVVAALANRGCRRRGASTRIVDDGDLTIGRAESPLRMRPQAARVRPQWRTIN